MPSVQNHPLDILNLIGSIRSIEEIVGRINSKLFPGSGALSQPDTANTSTLDYAIDCLTKQRQSLIQIAEELDKI